MAGAVAVVPATAAGAIAAIPRIVPAAETNLQLTEPLLWLMIGISVAGALVTFSFLVYAIWRFRDPSMRRRRHG